MPLRDSSKRSARWRRAQTLRLRALLFGAFFFFYVFYIISTTVCRPNIIYSRQDLLLVGLQRERTVTTEFLYFHKIPVDIARTAGSPWYVMPESKRRRCCRERKQKRGCRAGVWQRLRKSPYKPPLPSLFLTNARSVVNKMDELRLQLEENRFIRECCVMIISESWLHSGIPDAAVELTRRILHRHNRNQVSHKQGGGGLCIYISEKWASNTKTIDIHCSPDLEYLTVKCRPFFLHREFSSAVLITAVYIAPG